MTAMKPSARRPVSVHARLGLTLAPLVVACCALLAPGAHAQPVPTPGTPAAAAPTPETSPLDAELFYQLLLGELKVRDGDPGAAFSLVLDAARRVQSAQLYRRAVDIALQARSGEAALSAADAWASAFERSGDPLRLKLQILLALNRLPDTVPVVRRLVELAPVAERDDLLLSVAPTFARVNDKPRATEVVREALRPYLSDSPHAPAAWATVGRLELASGRAQDALEAAQRGQAASVRSRHPALLALQLMDNTRVRSEAESLVQRYLAVAPGGETGVRLGYAQVLLDLQRPAQAMQQLEAVAAEPQAPAEAWLLIGNAHARANRAEAATSALERYLQKTENQDDDSVERGRTQAFLQLAQLAEKRQDFTAANAWLDRIENPQELLPAQSRRASILARQGRVDEALALLRNTPERLPSDARAKLSAEAQLLRDLKRYEEAYALYENAPARLRDDPEVVYEQAMVAERAGRLADFERLMRALIERQPDSPLAFNALGYSLADRNLRLDEAKTLIQQAVKLAPDDAYIQDSLAWVEFRLGNRAEALRLLQAAYAKRPDVEIAAHLGEVLWVNGERDKALAIWREGLLLDSEAEVLRETFKRFQVQP